jgi:hypothetical protein
MRLLRENAHEFGVAMAAEDMKQKIESQIHSNVEAYNALFVRQEEIKDEIQALSEKMKQSSIKLDSRELSEAEKVKHEVVVDSDIEKLEALYNEAVENKLKRDEIESVMAKLIQKVSNLENKPVGKTI